MNIPYDEAKLLIKEADVLLFRASTFPGVGWWISSYTRSPYSHAALAHWDNDDLTVLEFREFYGSRQYSLQKYLEEGKQIDVFRAAETIIKPKVVNNKLSYDELNFNADIALQITQTAKDLIGKKYSYWTIWQIFKTYVPFVRLRTKIVKNGEPDTKSFVCSTLVTYAYRKNFIDPIPFLSDEYTSPGDLARSVLFSQLFSIKN